jgi:hypothetical protein
VGDANVVEHIGIHQQHIAAAGDRIGDSVHREHAAQFEPRIEDDFRTRLPAQPIEFGLDQLVAKPQGKHHVVDADGLEQIQVPLQQAHAAESQQALR